MASYARFISPHSGPGWWHVVGAVNRTTCGMVIKPQSDLDTLGRMADEDFEVLEGDLRCDRCGATRSAHEPGDLRMSPGSTHAFVEPRQCPPCREGRLWRRGEDFEALLTTAKNFGVLSA